MQVDKAIIAQERAVTRVCSRQVARNSLQQILTNAEAGLYFDIATDVSVDLSAQKKRANFRYEG